MIILSRKGEEKGVLPNFFHGDVLLNLLNGDFRYTPVGLLDWSHLHFFGLKNIFALFTECGYQIHEIRTTNYNIGETELRIDQENIPKGLLRFIRSLPNSSVYQFIFKASPSPVINLPILEKADFFKLFSDSFGGDAQLLEMIKRNRELQETITVKDVQLQEISERNRILQDTISTIAIQLHEMTINLQQMERSMIWQITNRFHWGFVERLLPENTRRRGWYDFGLKGGKVLMNEGPGSLWENFQKYLHDRKVEKHTNKETHEYPRPRIESVPDPEDIPDLHSIKELVFPQPATPIVSIIVPVYNNWKFTYTCLQSILSNTKEVAYEVIMADDCSTDRTQEMMKKIKGITAINNGANLGFLKNCNNAAKYARGKYLLFLNNDTFVLNGCLEALLECAEKNENAAIIGPNIIAPDGRLLENGWIIGTNGWGQPIGRGEDPTAYHYNYVKEVDCVTGACFWIRKDVFFDAGSFNELYSPAYYEEFDLAFSVKKMGYKVMVQPKAMLIHYDCSSYGKNSRNKLAAINHQKFIERWNSELQKRSTEFTCNYLMRDKLQGKKVLLVIDNSVPLYNQNAGSLMMFQYSQLFQEMGFKVIFLPDNLEKLEPYTHDMQKIGIEIIYGKFDFDSWIKENGRYLDIVFLSRPGVSIKYIDKVRKYSKARILYCMQDLHYLRHLRRSRIEANKNSLKESRRLKKIEYNIFQKADVILTFSDVEADILLHDLPHKHVEIIPLFAYDIFPDHSELPSFEERKNIIFLGGFEHIPNVDAVQWFVKECFPSVVSRIEDIKFIIVGSNPPQTIKDLSSNNIEVIGQVKDLWPYFQNARIFVAPLRFGAGVKGKLITSMYYGVPIITTTIGAEGLELGEGENALVADDENAFASKIVELYTNKNLWEKLSINCSNYVRTAFTKQRAREKIRDILR